MNDVHLEYYRLSREGKILSVKKNLIPQKYQNIDELLVELTSNDNENKLYLDFIPESIKKLYLARFGSMNQDLTLNNLPAELEVLNLRYFDTNTKIKIENIYPSKIILDNIGKFTLKTDRQINELIINYPFHLVPVGSLCGHIFNRLSLFITPLPKKITFIIGVPILNDNIIQGCKQNPKFENYQINIINQGIITHVILTEK